MPSQTVFYGSSFSNPKDKAKEIVKKMSTDTGVHIRDTVPSQDLTKQLYKQNLDLAIVNKTLNVIKTIYAITMASLDIKDVAQKLVDAMATELNFSVVLISLIDQEKKVLRPIAITRSPEILNALEIIGKPLEEIEISLSNRENLAIHAISDEERKISGNLLDILTPYASQEEADKIEMITKIRTLILYPIMVGSKCLGVLNIALAKKVDDLSRVEKETLEQLIGVVGISLDRAQLYDNLKIANAKLQDLDKLKDEFVSLASHELRTPMTAIKGSLSTILEGYAGNVSNESREFLTAAYNENDRLIRLVNNLLNISRIEAGRFTFKVTNVDVEKLITEVVTNLQPAAKERNIFLKYEKNESIPNVLGDEDKVKEVIINLVGNATKFTHQGGITVKNYIENKMLITSVADTGSGIAKEDLDRLFKKFSQVGGDYARPAGGTGLGLYICKQIVEGLNGRIWLESILGKGTTFFFSLPITQ